MTEMLQTLKGFRDFLPKEMQARDFIITRVKEIFRLFAFEPLETPTLEYASLLLGKYGEEADRLVYSFKDRGKRHVALRYDQTVPTARILAQYQHELPRYFRRYQIQNVFRADKPQKGRYREFTQCDIDIFGTTSALADAEIVACTYFAFKNIGYPTIQIKINDRKTLFKTLKPFEMDPVDVFSIIQSIDKLDKQSKEDVLQELVDKGLGREQARRALETIEGAPISENLREIIDATLNLGVPEEVLEYAPTLARGLDYYTGMIFEVFVPEYPVGSFAGGGRYDNLIEQLGGPSIPATGIAFGFDRMVEGAIELGLIPLSDSITQVLVTVFDEDTAPYSLKVANQLREAGIRTEVYPELDKLGKQMKTADQKSVPFVVIAGPDEVKQDVVTVRNMKSGEQETPRIEVVAGVLRGKLAGSEM
ncbi:MAG: histidine--tRNA ligase [Anaerolineales bacterium]|jgi:histidyl-tRNA synthetase